MKDKSLGKTTSIQQSFKTLETRSKQCSPSGSEDGHNQENLFTNTRESGSMTVTAMIGYVTSVRSGSQNNLCEVIFNYLNIVMTHTLHANNTPCICIDTWDLL